MASAAEPSRRRCRSRPSRLRRRGAGRGLVLASALVCVFGATAAPIAPAGATQAPRLAPASPADATSSPGPVKAVDQITTTDSSTVVPFTALGLATPVPLVGVSASTSVFLPVPEGLTPTSLAGVLVGAPGTPAGDVVFSSAGHRLAAVHLANEGAGGTTPFSVPLDGVIAVNGQLRIDIEASLPLIDAYCQGQFLIPEVDLDSLAVTYGGRATSPATIATFLPPFLATLRVWVPAAPTGAVAEGAIDIADQVVARYGAAQVRIEVKPLSSDLPDPGPFDPLSRDIVFSGPSATAGAQLVSSPAGAPLLAIAGDGDPLRHQVDVIVSELVKLVASDHVTAGGQFIPRRIPAPEQRFTELGLASPAVHGQAEGSLRLTVKFSQADFGHMIDWVRLHVSGTYTPVPVGAAANLNVFFNGQLVASELAGRSGSFHVAPVIPVKRLSRDNTVEVRFQYIPADGVCSRFSVPVEVQLSADASVETRAGASLPIGFQRLPQALLPGTDCAVDVLSPDRLAAAVKLFAGLQRLTRTPLAPRVIPFDQVVNGARPAVLLTADPGSVAPLHPIVDLGAPAPELDIDAKGGQIGSGTAPAVAQVFVQHGRHLLIAETRPEAASSLGPLVDALTAVPGIGRWTHDVVVLGPGGHADEVAVRDTVRPPAPAVSNPPIRIRWWEWPALACLPLVVAAGVWRLILLRRRA